MSGANRPSPSSSLDWRLARNVVLKAALLFLLINFGFAWLKPLTFLGHLSAYNHLLPGRTRLPYGENPSRDYSLSPFSLEALLASHEIAATLPDRVEYRVVLIGDSSAWGFLLPANQTMAAYVNAASLTTASGRPVHLFNLGYPIMSLMKDLVLLDRAMGYHPDLIVWLVTLESFPTDKQLYPPLLQHNPDTVRRLIRTYDLALDPYDPRLVDPSFWDQTLIGQRRALADLLRLQLYGIPWAATGIDQDIPETYTARMEDLPADDTFQGFGPSQLTLDDLAFDVLAAGIERAGATPVLIVNEPMFVSRGRNSDIRYNFFYPRWAYDEYRRWLAERGGTEGWDYADLWDAIPASEFTDSAIHYSPSGAQILADRIAGLILERADQAP